MQLSDLVKPIEDMSDEELKKRLFDIRHRRETERPVAKAKAKKAATKKSNKKVSEAEKMLADLTPDEIMELMKELGGREE